MAQASIPVDLFNPGQVFACLGFMEAAEVLLGDAEARFDWSDASKVRFLVGAAGERNPFQRVLEWLSRVEVRSLAPVESPNRTDSWGVATTRVARRIAFPSPDPDSPATLPAILTEPESEPQTLMIDHWGDATRRDAVKFWAGAAGYPGAAITRDAIELVRDRCATAFLDPFALAAPQTSSFRFDWRRDYIPIDAGFSLNVHDRILSYGFPLVEIFAAIGLTDARPDRIKALEYRYAVAGCSGERESLLPPMIVRAALGCADVPFDTRSFHMRLGWPGKAGQARAITVVTEETKR